MTARHRSYSEIGAEIGARHRAKQADMESIFDEMRRYVAFGEEDEQALRLFAPLAVPHFGTIVDEFYRRILEHEDARRVLTDQAQVARLKISLQSWLSLLVSGPWDAEYHQNRARVGRTHARISLPQRYVLGSMNVIRLSLLSIAAAELDAIDQRRVAVAIDKIVDLELAIMLETATDGLLGRVKELETAERDVLVQRLKLSEARYHEFVETGEALVVTWEPGGRIAQLNGRCEELMGISHGDANDKTWSELFGGEPARFVARERDLLAGTGTPVVETIVLDRAEQEHRIRWHHTIFHEPERTIICAIGLDVTAEHLLGVRTRRAERLASLGTMAAGLAHEVRNPLNAAHLQLKLVERHLSRPVPEIASALDAAALADTHVERLAALVTEFLDFGRPHALRMTRRDLRGTVEAIVALLHPEAAAAGVDLATELGMDPVVLSYDDEKIKQVVLNLTRNALEATPAGGEVRVRVSTRGNAAVLEVTDTGPGLSTPDAPLFEPFYTTKETGTGLGLPIVYRIVTDHEGVVDVQSRPGRTVFSVALPLDDGARRSGGRSS